MLKFLHKRDLLLAFLIAIALGIASIAVWIQTPLLSIERSSGLYQREGQDQPYFWTGSQVHFPLQSGCQALQAELLLGSIAWPGRSAPRVELRSDSHTLASFAIDRPMRRYQLLLPPCASYLNLRTTVDRAPAPDRRWLGLQLYAAHALPQSAPLLPVGRLLLAFSAAFVLALAVVALLRRGYGYALGLFGLALLLRCLRLAAAPPGFNQDEAVSLVDAWHLLQTGRDHLQHSWPLGAQEAFGDWISPLLTYLELPLVALLGPQPLAGRITTALIGALAAPILYGTAQTLGIPRQLALVAGLVAALSPWQIFLSRFAIPPALVPTSWGLTLWLALLFVERGGRRQALLLALSAGFALYAYPTLKLAVPALVLLALALALFHHGWGASRRWLPAALLLVLLWLPFLMTTFLNPAASTRLNQTLLRASSPLAWAARWGAGYLNYFRPAFYYSQGDGDPTHGVPGYGVQLPIEAPFVLLGLAGLIWRLLAARRSNPPGASRYGWGVLAGALLLAPLPASLTLPNPHTLRAATIAPVYALLVACGIWTLWQLSVRLTSRAALQTGIRLLTSIALLGILLVQSGTWLQNYLQRWPALVVREYQDGLLQAIERAVAYDDEFSEIRIAADDINEPYIYVLAARPFSSAEIQQQLVVERPAGKLNRVTALGHYQFEQLASLPADLPALEAIPNRFGGLGFVLQVLQESDRRILIVRRMPN